MKALIFAVALPLLAVGCASSTSQIHEVPVGPEPTRAEAERVVRDLLNKTLKDPDSIKQFHMGSIQKTRYYTGMLNGNYWEGGWRVCFEYNAKNSYGGYVGLQRTGLVLRCRDSSQCEYLSRGGGFETASC